MFGLRGKRTNRINPNGWMMSYADMATILLALFIVLSTLGKDQTGIRFTRGMESYRRAAATFGLGALMEGGKYPLPASSPAPPWPTEDPGEDGGPAGQSLDAAEERLEKFLDEMQRKFQVDQLPRTQGKATLDLFEPLNHRPPYLKARHTEVLYQLGGLLRRPGYRITLVVWATTPSDSAWVRAAEQAQFIGDELTAGCQLSQSARARLTTVGQPWPHPTFQRPVLSLTITRLARQ